MERDEALAWFLAGFAESGERFNPHFLTDWDDEDHPVREAFDEQWPNPEHEDMVRTAEERREFAERVEKDGLYGALPKTNITFSDVCPKRTFKNGDWVVDDEQPSGVSKRHVSIVEGTIAEAIMEELDEADLDVETIVSELDGDNGTDEREVCPDFYCGNWADECEKHE